MKKGIFLAICFSLFSIASVKSQDSTNDINSSAEWTIFWNSAVHSSDRGEGFKYAPVGFGVKVQRLFAHGIGIEAKLAYRDWDNEGMQLLPFTIGPLFTLTSNDKYQLIFRTGVGPEAALGNDWAGIFFGYEFGTEIHLNVGDGHAFVIGIAFGQALAFHPGQLEHFNFTLGWRF